MMPAMLSQETVRCSKCGYDYPQNEFLVDLRLCQNCRIKFLEIDDNCSQQDNLTIRPRFFLSRG